MPNLKIFLFFFVAAIAGTLLHELGHIAVAYINGCESVHLGYAYMRAHHDFDHYPPLSVIGEQYYNTVHNKMVWQNLGGPLQTNLTGIVGLILLSRASKRTTIDAWNTQHLLYIVLCFFFSRSVFNALIPLSHLRMFKAHSMGDETTLFMEYGINNNLGHLVLLIISAALLAYACFVLVQKHRAQLIIWGALGSFAGALFWMGWIGPIVLP